MVPLYAAWWLFLATGGGDLAAQYAWAGFVSEHGGAAYNLSWYGGMHIADYSLISPYVMAAVGVRTVTVVSGLTASWLAAVLIRRTGTPQPLAPALLSSLALWCDAASGRTTFALGVALGLAACVLLTGQKRIVLAAAYAALATMVSPVAGLFLAVVGAGFLLAREVARAGALLVPPAAVTGLTAFLFPFTGEQPIPESRLWPSVVLALAVTVLAPPRWRTARWSGAVYAAGTVLAHFVASPAGANAERFAELFAPAVLLAALAALPRTARIRRVLLVAALVCSLIWVGEKTADDLKASTVVPAWASDTRGVLRALDRLGADRARVEVVPARDHREASGLGPHLGLARGGNHRLDMDRARLFHDGTLSAAAYRAWLNRWAVGFVALPAAGPDGYARDAREEARLLRERRPGWLEPVWQDANWTVYRVRDAVPLVSSPGSVVRASPADLVLRVSRPGEVTVRIAYSPWLRSDGGCLTRRGEFTRLSVLAAGEYRISSEYGPSADPQSRC
jgi:hypothetical protein